MQRRRGWEIGTRRGVLSVVLTGLIAGSAFAPPTNDEFLMPGMVRDPDNEAWYSRCHHPRGATQADANNIATELYNTLQRHNVELDAGDCFMSGGNTTMLTVCNKGPKARRVTYQAAMAMHDHLVRDCGYLENRDANGNVFEKPLGGLRHEDDLEWHVWGPYPAQSSKPKNSGSKKVRRHHRTHAENRLRRYCDPMNMPLDAEWHDECWKPNSHFLDSAGDCPIARDKESPCMQYCEMRRRYMLGPEQPFANTALARCPRGAATCTWSDSLSVTISKGWLFQLGGNIPKLDFGPVTGTPTKGITNIMNQVINWGYAEMESKTEGVTHSGAHSFAGREDWCGYWTFIPYLTQTEGTISVYRQYDDPTRKNYACMPYGAEPPITYRGQRAQKPIVGADGRPIGQSVLVWYDCETGRHAPDSEQNPEYLRAGVEKMNGGPGA